MPILCQLLLALGIVMVFIVKIPFEWRTVVRPC